MHFKSYDSVITAMQIRQNVFNESHDNSTAFGLTGFLLY